jgi:uncharacterized protein YbjQ (UPF0145 family)
MKLFGFGGDEKETLAKQRAEESQRSIQAGGLPLNAIERLKEASREDFFTSNLSASELLLTHECGFSPLGQVMGSSVYNVGWQSMPSNWGWTSGELQTITAAHYEARHLALGRLRQEAKLLGADGVVGVRLERGNFDWGTGMLEFIAIGTAVRRTGTPPSHGEPFVSALSGADHWTLLKSGYRPVGFCLGNCTWYQVASWATQRVQNGGLFGGGWNSQELTEYTQAVYTARELAMTRMRNEAEAVGAEGIVGAFVETHTEIREVGDKPPRPDLVASFTAIGTAVVHDEPVRISPALRVVMLK